MHRCWAEIDLEAIRHNARIARQRAGAKVELMAVIKANAYGHGVIEVAKALAEEAQLFALANLTEATQARQFIPHPIVIFGPALPDERKGIVAGGFIPSVSSYDEAREFGELGPVTINFKVDTGMGRMGAVENGALADLQKIVCLKNVRLHSVSTHLPSAEEDATYTKSQLARFHALVRQVRAAVPGDYKIHACASAGVLGFDNEGFDIIRVGLMLYGVSPAIEFQDDLRPALALKSRVVLVRDLPAGSSISYGRTFIAQRPTRAATLALGYEDGLPRALSNRGASVLLNGRRCPILGRVTMDLTVVDVTDAGPVAVADEAVIIGKQGDEEITAREVAQRAAVIPWEIFTGIGSRVARVYH